MTDRPDGAGEAPARKQTELTDLDPAAEGGDVKGGGLIVPCVSPSPIQPIRDPKLIIPCVRTGGT